MRKYDLISALSEETARRVARNDESWKKYLNTASGLYKYPFKDQLLIYAQRPDATAVHFFIPYLYGSTGCRIRSLGIDEKLVFERVFVKP